MTSHVSVESEARIDSAMFLRPQREKVCAALKSYPRSSPFQLALEKGVISPLCQPFVGSRRERLDRCDDPASDPYSKSGSQSGFTWNSRAQLRKRGKINILAEIGFESARTRLLERVEELRKTSRAFCCGDDLKCAESFDRVTVKLCEPHPDPNAPDPCSFGGTFRVPGRTYRAIFAQLREVTADAPEASEIRQLAERNLPHQDGANRISSEAPSIGSVVLTSYLSKDLGFERLEPVVLHEFGHACSLVRMKTWALDAIALPPNSGNDEILSRSLRATHWLDSARRRCEKDLELPTAYDDFWGALGETRALSACLKKIAVANRDGRVDRQCSGVCPGHYLEEASAIAFALLTGDLTGSFASVFPNTCDHVRDGQHPMVSDVVECLAQHSSRFRDRLDRAYGCSENAADSAQ